MKQFSVNHLLLPLLFILFISLPMSISFLSADQSVSQTEKRKLAKLTDLEFSLTSLEKFPAVFDNYIGDHFGFRDRIVRAHNYLLVKLFGVSPTGLVILGTSDWYFFTADAAIKDYLGNRQLGPRKLESIYYLLQDRKYWLNSIGSEYIFLPIPNKEMIYDEYLPAQIRKHRGLSIYQRILSYLREKNTFQDYIDVEQVMLSRKDEMQLFLRTDSHWNHDGSFLTYQQIIDKVKQWYPDIHPLEKSSERKMIRDFSGDLTILMNLRGLITEDAPDVVVDNECRTREEKRMETILEIPQYRDLARHRLPVQGGCSEQKYTAVVLHDSFGRFLKPYLSQQFETVTYINSLSFEDAKTIIEREKPDVVIDQRVARNVLKSLKSDGELAQLVLGDRFEDLPETVTNLDSTHIRQTIKIKGAGNISEYGTGVKVELENGDSAVALGINKSDGSPAPDIFKIDMSSSQDTSVILCYQQETDTVAATPQCTRRDLVQGQNFLFFRVFNPKEKGTLVINPVMPGQYLFNSIVVKKENI